jgi:hypothetical protein
MTGEEIVRQVRDASEGFQVTCRKFAGAVTAELMKTFLADEGISTSARDVYIRGVPLEIDLIVPRRGRKPTFGLVYEPRQVAAALEIKKNGSFGEPTLSTIKSNFNRLRALNVKCAYVAIEERETYCWRATRKNIGGFPCFTLCWHKGETLIETQDWARLLAFLRKCASA